MHRFRCSLALLAVLGALSLPAGAQAKTKKVKAAAKNPQDSIDVVGHVSPSGGAILRFLATQHYSSYYLYAEHEGGKVVTLIDVTKANHPSVLGEMASSTGESGTLSIVAGTAALVTNAPVAADSHTAETIRIMDFSDAQHPKVIREFTGVTATTRDDRRGLIFVANGDGIWILQQHFAQDPEVEKAYAHHVVYDH